MQAEGIATRIGGSPPSRESDMSMPLFFNCGCCGCYHPEGFDGDCRDDSLRFSPDDLDSTYGQHGWLEIADPLDEVNHVL